jgi:hypothetical protein
MPPVAETRRPRPKVSRGLEDRLDWGHGHATKHRGRSGTSTRKRGFVARLSMYSRIARARWASDDDTGPSRFAVEESTLAWLGPVARVFHEFRTLEDNWDSEGGVSIKPTNMQAAFGFLWSVVDADVRLPLPSIQPTSSGGIGLLWESPGVEVEIAFDEDGDSGVVFTRNGHTGDAPIEQAASILLSVADHL